ncbi:MAG: hypothetical protein V5A33_03560 [Halobacteriales archaeon]
MTPLPSDVTGTATTTKAAVAGVLLLVAAIAVVVAGPALDGPGADATDGRNGRDDPDVVVEDVAGERTVTVTYSTANGTHRFVVEDVDPALVDARRNWAYLPRSALPPALERVAGNHAAGVVPAGDWALVGDLNGAFAREGNASVHVVAPAGEDVDPARKAGFLAAFTGPYALVHDENATDAEPVTLIVAPDALPAAGVMYDDAGYVTQHAFWDGEVSSVWIHEYVHAKRNVALGPSMRWFSEASATYFSIRMLEEQFEGVTEGDVRDRLAVIDDHEDTPLSSRAAWEDTHADYDRGAKLLYVVDAAVRTGSDGDHTVVDVFRAMNRHGGPITVEEFVRIVERFSGEDEAWLHRAITEGGDLDALVEESGDAFED